MNMIRPVLCLMVVPFLLSSSRLAFGSEAGDSEREIRALEAAVSQAILKADRDFFDKQLADDFTHTSHTGRFVNKGQWLGELRPGQSLYQLYEVDELVVRIYGETAVATGRSMPAGTNSKGQLITGKYRFTRVWVRREGEWKAVAFQGTRIEQP